MTKEPKINLDLKCTRYVIYNNDFEYYWTNTNIYGMRTKIILRDIHINTASRFSFIAAYILHHVYNNSDIFNNMSFTLLSHAGGCSYYTSGLWPQQCQLLENRTNSILNEFGYEGVKLIWVNDQRFRVDFDKSIWTYEYRKNFILWQMVNNKN